MKVITHDPYAALRIADFRLFIFSRLFLTLSVQMQTVVVGWQIYDLTKDPLALGLIGLAEFLPSISVSLIAGHVADIVPRKRIIVACMALLLFCTGSLFYFTTDLSTFLARYNALPIYIVIFISGFARGFIGPALFSFMPQLVSREIYANAITWNSSTWQAAAVGGPALGGLIYGFHGISISYFTDLSLMIIAIALMSFVKSRPVPPSDESASSIFERIKVGIKFVFTNQLILSAISLDLFAVLFGGAVALLPVFAKDILHEGPQALGYLRAAPALGAVTMAVIMAYKPIKQQAGLKMLGAVAGFGLAMIVFAVSKNFWLSFAALLMSGVFDSISVIIRSTLVHTLTPESMKGRVSAVNNIFIGSSNELGAFESGVAARFLGVVPSVIFGGCMTLLVVAVTRIKAKKLKSLNLD
ncbi:MAG: MFS transporter [Sporocytophaga sp.]|uniref:MFS transporter n=1 Tax=Sporocytophaga sp. TaxID=2231183 RepID=UPI001AFE9DAD|nr:MFS transporter [Sporocytophaga sp.]MBO9700165.1 MFS transporter [Sporocytophaga sp.]